MAVVVGGAGIWGREWMLTAANSGCGQGTADDTDVAKDVDRTVRMSEVSLYPLATGSHA